MRIAAGVIAALVLAGCLGGPEIAPAAVVAGLPSALELDPTLPGALAVETFDYDLGRFVHTEFGAYVIDLRGEAYVPDGDGRFPVVVLQHGRHPTCDGLPFTPFVLGPPECPDLGVIGPVESFRGYRYLGENLASHGYVVLSVDANRVNSADGAHDFVGTGGDAGGHARAEIILQTLDRLRDLDENGDDARFAGKLDLSRVGLMGHSRGGEGVVLALDANLARAEGDRHAILAVFSLAPIDRNAVTADGAAFAVLLPWCDGDVSSLAGARIYDDTRSAAGFARTQLVVMGANHNFYNTVWEEGDDGARWERDTDCAPSSRPTADEQRAEGLAHMASFFRLHLGSETQLAGLFDGSRALPPAACPAALACERFVHVSHVPAQAPTALESPVLVGFGSETECAPPDCSTDAHVAGSASRRVIAWDGPATLATTVPEGARVDAVSFRIGFDASAPGNDGRATQDLRVQVVDADGAMASTLASAHSAALFVPSGSKQGPLHVVLNEVRVPIGAFAGIDAAAVREVRLVFDATPAGEAHVADLSVLQLLDEVPAPDEQ